MKELHVENFTVLKKVLGKDLEGLHYEHPLSDIIPEQKRIEQVKSSGSLRSCRRIRGCDDRFGSGPHGSCKR